MLIYKRYHEKFVNDNGDDAMYEVAKGHDEHEWFLGGLSGTSVQTSFVGHIALRLWEDEVRNKNFT